MAYDGEDPVACGGLRALELGCVREVGEDDVVAAAAQRASKFGECGYRADGMSGFLER